MANKKKENGSKPKRQGVPKGKRNKRKRGFYSGVLENGQKQDLEVAVGVDGVDDEIALLRVKIKALMEKDPENIALLMTATNTLARLINTRYNIAKGQKKGLKEALTNVLRDIAVPLGIGIGTNFIK
jgi:hypothetical protein